MSRKRTQTSNIVEANVNEHCTVISMLRIWSIAFCVGVVAVAGPLRASPRTFSTRYAAIRIDDRGFITSLASRKTAKEYCPPGHPSPLLSLHESGQANETLICPKSAVFSESKGEFVLTFSNGASAVVKAAEKGDYLRFQLVSLAPRGAVDNIIWGPLHTTVSGKIGDIIGVVRDDDWAIGMYGLDDNTIAGPVVDGDCYSMGYYVHSPDPAKYPVPPQYKEGQRFSVGGNGVNDVAFYSHPEEYFQQVLGTGAKLDPEFGSTVAYHARDRRKSYAHYFSLLPGFQRSRPRHQVSDPVEGVDFNGSAVALYACPDDQGLAAIEKIILGEGLPHIVIDGNWIRNPAAFRPQLYWSGPYDKCIEYAAALGLKDISRDTREFYPCLDNHWIGGGVAFSNGRKVTGIEFMEEAHRHGMTFGGLHTLTMFLQGGISRDVTPVPSERLQTVCRTKLANDVSATDTNIVVTDPSFLAEKGTWPRGDDSNYLRIGEEMLRYGGISSAAPWTLTGVKRGHASKAVPHKAGDELVKLQLNCYNGFVPDMQRLPEYADYYADLMARNGLESIDFDGLESTIYQNHGYYAVRVFFRRLFDTYARLTGGKRPRVTGSCVFAGGWEYMDACNLGGGNHMFDPVGNRWGIEGKDFRNGFGNSYYPATFGIQGFQSWWTQYDAENLEAKSIGWDATYALSVSQAAVDRCGEKEGILKAFHAWETARAAGVFSPAIKKQLRNMDCKAHIEQTGEKSFVVSPVKETRLAETAGRDTKWLSLVNAGAEQPLQFVFQIHSSTDGAIITLPDGARIHCDRKIGQHESIVCKGTSAYLADGNLRKIIDLPLERLIRLPHGEAKLGVQFPSTGTAQVHFGMVYWALGPSEKLGD
jgi:hypothetical protein